MKTFKQFLKEESLITTNNNEWKTAVQDISRNMEDMVKILVTYRNLLKTNKEVLSYDKDKVIKTITQIQNKLNDIIEIVE